MQHNYNTLYVNLNIQLIKVKSFDLAKTSYERGRRIRIRTRGGTRSQKEKQGAALQYIRKAHPQTLTI